MIFFVGVDSDKLCRGPLRCQKTYSRWRYRPGPASQKTYNPWRYRPAAPARKSGKKHTIHGAIVRPGQSKNIQSMKLSSAPKIRKKQIQFTGVWLGCCWLRCRQPTQRPPAGAKIKFPPHSNSVSKKLPVKPHPRIYYYCLCAKRRTYNISYFLAV